MINMCSETSPPRISFSNDLGPPDDDDDDDDDQQLVLEHNQSRRDTSLLDSNCDFEFSFTSSNGHESSSADELFSHGVILPRQPRERVYSPKQRKDGENPYLPSLPPLPSQKKEGKKEAMVVSSDMKQKTQSKSFWGFKRSSSLNYENKRSLLCSLPLLLRSNSTGSASNSKKSMFKDLNKHSSKQPSISMAKSASVSSSSSSSSSTSNPYTLLQKPPVKKNHGGGSYGNGFRIIPVINLPPPYISKGTAKFFGLGSILHQGKDKKTMK